MTEPADRPLADALTAPGLEPLNARSVILSSLLGSHPPVQSARGLVALAELFGIRPGTIRTSLSRMVAAGELESADSDYRLTGRLLERQLEQDVGRREPDRTWDGAWWTVVVASDRRSVAERRSFRTSMHGSGLAELRPEVWLRPANTPAPPRSPGVLVTRGPLDCDDVDELVARLWDLDEIEATARLILDAITLQRPRVRPGNDADLPTTFMVAAAAVRFLRVEPRLPSALSPADWTADLVRPAYRELQRAFGHQIRDFFESA